LVRRPKKPGAGRRKKRRIEKQRNSRGGRKITFIPKNGVSKKKGRNLIRLLVGRRDLYKLKKAPTKHGLVSGEGGEGEKHKSSCRKGGNKLVVSA